MDGKRCCCCGQRATQMPRPLAAAARQESATSSERVRRHWQEKSRPVSDVLEDKRTRMPHQMVREM